MISALIVTWLQGVKFIPVRELALRVSHQQEARQSAIHGSIQSCMRLLKAVELEFESSLMMEHPWCTANVDGSGSQAVSDALRFSGVRLSFEWAIQSCSFWVRVFSTSFLFQWAIFPLRPLLYPNLYQDCWFSLSPEWLFSP